MAKLDILLVEDNPGDVRLVREGLREIDTQSFELSHAESLTQALQLLEGRTFDAGLLDLALPDARGLEVVRRVNHTAPDMALIVLTGLSDQTVAIQSLQQGAQDFLVKANFDGQSLWRAMRYAMERQQLRQRLVSQSLVDDLTGLTNRKGFLSLAGYHAKLAHRTGKTFLVAFADLDRLKWINDTFGHQEGNRALVETARVLRDSFRQSDVIARYGGDEFVVLVADASADSAATVTERVQAKVDTRNTQRGHRYVLSLSIGVVSSRTTHRPNIARLLAQADTRMYQDKQSRRMARGSSSSAYRQARTQGLYTLSGLRRLKSQGPPESA